MAGRGRPPKYPWTDWLDGERYVLNSREHFPGVDKMSFRQQALNEAARRGVSISTKTTTVDGVDYVLITSRPPPKTVRIDWDKLFAAVAKGGVVLRHGREFTCSTQSMRIRVYQAAQRRGPIPVTIVIEGDAVSIYPQKSTTGMASKEQEAAHGQ